MSSSIELAMKSLAAAVVARRLYFPDHPAVAAGIAAAHQALSQVLSSERQIALHMVEGRVIGPDGTLACSADVRAGLFEVLGKLGRSSISFSQGLAITEIAELVSALGVSEAHIPTLAHIRLGAAEVTEGVDGGLSTGPALPAVQLVDAYRAAWQPAEQSGSVQPDQLELAAAGVCAAVMGARGTVLELATLKSHDEYTYVHTINVALLAAALAEACGLSASQVHQLTQAALMHDIGKRVIPLSVLNKNGQLDESERRLMNCHPVEGARLLIGQGGIPDFATVVAFEHHMHLDGTGYPKRPAHWKPNLAAMIVQQADVFDALRTHRPYRAAMPTQQACKILQEGSGSKYDAALVDVFVSRVVGRSTAGPVDIADKAA